MKKYLFSLLLVALLIAPVVGQTATLQELQCQLYEISHQIWQVNGSVGPEPAHPAECGIIPPVPNC